MMGCGEGAFFPVSTVKKYLTVRREEGRDDQGKSVLKKSLTTAMDGKGRKP